MSWLRRRLPVTVNDLVLVRGERLVMPWQPGAGGPSRETSVEVSVRHSPPVQTIMHTAPITHPIGDLIDKLAAEFPDGSGSATDASQPRRETWDNRQLTWDNRQLVFLRYAYRCIEVLHCRNGWEAEFPQDVWKLRPLGTEGRKRCGSPAGN
jgi:hypothetical protein